GKAGRGRGGRWRVPAKRVGPARKAASNLFVGRDPQLRLLDDAFRRVAGERTCLLVTVLGTAGMGKSRLADEFAATLGDATVLTRRCLSYGQGATHWPLRQGPLRGRRLPREGAAGRPREA